MVNEPHPWQLTVGQLRESLEGAPDDQVVVFALTAGAHRAEAIAAGLTTIVNIAPPKPSAGHVLVLRPLTREETRTP